MQKRNAAAWLATLILFSCFGFGPSSVTVAAQEKPQPALLMWTAEFDGHALCMSRDLLLQCAGYQQTLSSFKVTGGLVIVGMEYRHDALTGQHFSRSQENQGTAFVIVSAVGDARKRIFLPINEASRSSIDGVSVAFPAGSVLTATYFAAGPSEPIVAGKLIVRYTIP
jgi:hypothetical protein